MITKQYQDALRSAITGKAISMLNVSGSAFSGSVPKDPGSSKYRYTSCLCYNIPYLMQNRRTSSTDTSEGGYCFGTGTTTPTENDYLYKTMLSLPSGVTVNVAYTQEGETCMARYTVLNGSTQDLTITEVALIGNCMFSSSSIATYLVDRTLLDEPLTIAKGGGVGQIVYTVDIS